MRLTEPRWTEQIRCHADKLAAERAGVVMLDLAARLAGMATRENVRPDDAMTLTAAARIIVVAERGLSEMRKLIEGDN